MQENMNQPHKIGYIQSLVTITVTAPPVTPGDSSSLSVLQAIGIPFSGPLPSARIHSTGGSFSGGIPSASMLPPNHPLMPAVASSPLRQRASSMPRVAAVGRDEEAPVLRQELRAASRASGCWSCLW